MSDSKKDEWLDEPLSLGVIPGKQMDDASDVSYWHNVYELKKAPGVCLQNGHILSALKLIYSGIDNLGWLTRKHNRLYVEPKDFLKFVNEYLLPDSELLCSADELYGARCGLLHCNTAESKSSRSGKIRTLWYKSGDSSKEDDDKHVRTEVRDRIVLVNIDILYKAYNKCIERLNNKISKESEFANIIYRRSGGLFAIIPEQNHN